MIAFVEKRMDPARAITKPAMGIGRSFDFTSITNHCVYTKVWSLSVAGKNNWYNDKWGFILLCILQSEILPEIENCNNYMDTLNSRNASFRLLTCPAFQCLKK